METPTKKIAIIVLALIGLMGSFVGGAFFGTHFAFKFFVPAFGNELFARTLTSQLLIEKIDNNEIALAHNSIKTRLGGDILALDAIIEDTEDIKEKNRLTALLRRVAEHRAKFTQYYEQKENESAENIEENNSVREILKKYKRVN